jgi:hypothetical protein
VFNADGDIQPAFGALYTGVNVEDFSFYIQNGAQVGHTQDFLNPGVGVDQARALAFAGTDENTGCWFLCFEDGLVSDDQDVEHRDFDDMIVFMESVNPTPVTKATWASVKARFR